MIITLLSLALVSQPPIDKVAHFGVSYAINHAGYSLCKGVTKHKTGCLITSAVGALALGAAKELMDSSHNNAKEHAKDMAANLAGIGLSSLMITINW